MKLTVLGSGSSGNGYVLQNEHEALVLECGCKVKDCLRALDFRTDKVCGCLVTHEHGDHAKYMDQYMAYFPVYCSQGTASAPNIRYRSLRRPVALQPLKTVCIGGFSVRPIDVQHDAAEPFGYIIKHDEIGTLLFATDTYYIKYTIPGLTNIMIECNYSLPILKDNVRKGIVPKVVKERTLSAHMSLDHCKDMLLANDLRNVNRIVLIHLSSNNADPEMFRTEVELATGKNTVVANKGLEIKMNKTPF